MLSLSRLHWLRIPFLGALAAAFLACGGAPPTPPMKNEMAQSAAAVQSVARDSFTLWQMQSVDNRTMLSYVLLSPQNEVIVVDGGWPADAGQLAFFLRLLGNHVTAWYVTHPHPDHVGALATITQNKGDLVIDHIYGSFPSRDWLQTNAQIEPLPMYDLLARSASTVTEVNLGDVHSYDGMTVQILGVKNPEIVYNGVNNSSMIFRVSDAKKSVLFLGDLGVEEGKKLLASPYKHFLPSTYVQVAHHGWTNGIEDLYRQVNPKNALWPTTFDFVNGCSYISPEATQSAQTLLALFKEMGVTSYYSFNGLHRVD